MRLRGTQEISCCNGYAMQSSHDARLRRAYRWSDAVGLRLRNGISHPRSYDMQTAEPGV
jgi:hypothetical protein